MCRWKAVVNRYALGYAMLFGWIVVMGTVGFPCVLTAAVGTGILPPGGGPFPRDAFAAVVLGSSLFSVLTGSLTCWISLPRRDAMLARWHHYLARPERRLRFRFIGILIALPLIAAVLAPCAVLWITLERGIIFCGLASTLTDSFRLCSGIVGFLWLCIFLGRLTPRSRGLRGIVFRSRLFFLDWVLEPRFPKAAELERCKLRQWQSGWIDAA